MAFTITNLGSNLVNDNAVQLRIDGIYNDRGLDAGLRNIKNQSSVTEKQLKQLSSQTKNIDIQNASLGKTIAKTALIFGGYGAAIAGVVALGKKALDGAKEQELAESQLTRALKTAKIYTEELNEALKNQASAFQQLSTFGDDLIIKMQSLLVSYGMNEEQIKRTTQSAIDFSAATGRDLQSSVTLLAKAFKGQTGELSRYGIVLDESIPKNEKFNAVLKELNGLFGGAAESERTNTLTGALKAFGNAFGDLLENAMKPAMGFLTQSVNNLTDLVNTVSTLGYKLDKIESIDSAGKTASDYQKESLFAGNIFGTMTESGSMKYIADGIIEQVKIVSDAMQSEFYKATTESLNAGMLEQIKQGAGITQLSLSLYDNIYTAVSDAVLKGLTEKVIQEQAINPIAQAIQKLSFVQVGGEYTGEVLGLDSVIEAAKNAGKQIELMSPIIQMVNSELTRFKSDLYETATAGQTAGQTGSQAFREMAQAMKDAATSTDTGNQKLREGVAVLNEYANAAAQAAAQAQAVGESTSGLGGNSVRASQLSGRKFTIQNGAMNIVSVRDVTTGKTMSLDSYYASKYVGYQR